MIDNTIFSNQLSSHFNDEVLDYMIIKYFSGGKLMSLKKIGVNYNKYLLCIMKNSIKLVKINPFNSMELNLSGAKTINPNNIEVRKKLFSGYDVVINNNKTKEVYSVLSKTKYGDFSNIDELVEYIGEISDGDTSDPQIEAKSEPGNNKLSIDRVVDVMANSSKDDIDKLRSLKKDSEEYKELLELMVKKYEINNEISKILEDDNND